MNRTTKLTLLLAAATSIAGCQTMPNQTLTSTATQETIENAKAELDGQRFYKLNEYDQAIEVSDDGVIVFKSYLPRSGGYEWVPVVIQDSSFHVSCDYFREFVDAGMVVQAQFVGKGGRIEYYDKKRCEEYGEPVWN
ncbi:hypothetical protein [Vibrio owensii]|uniref:hypothetical protein n=1 Tax=Vibrio owensii TaxID=696485 RepID=UPI0038CD7D0C